jgi:guanyl-specific ribonuclease Sa
MKKPLLLGLALAVALVGLALWLPALRARLASPAPEAPLATPAAEATAPAATPSPSFAPSPFASPTPTAAPGLKSAGSARLDTQIRKVVESMDKSGRPPAGVAQGRRPGKEVGVFQNLERRLPRKAAGYYRESDVWPRRAGANRGPERLVFGRDGEVYYSADHYRSFVRLR